MSMVEIKGLGREKDESYPHHEMDYQVDASPKLKLEIISSDEECEKIIDAIKQHAHTGRRGDGKVVVYEIRELHSIRTGEKGEGAS
ncbi:MAG: P-II family nitrogen regulator [Candidatus Firestonebacteria bacterium]|nr:P-II family nitrogen regulator [Candidatus Firestonebacteria bacterium]